MDVMRILLVHEDPELLARLQRVLQEAQPSWEALTAPTAGQALALMQQAPVQLVIAGEALPDQNGINLLAVVRDQYPHVVRYLLTKSEEGMADSSNSAVVHRYLSQEIDELHLCNAVNRAATLSALMQNSALRDMLANIGTLPSLSGTSQRILRAIDSPNSSLHEIGEMVGRDPSITAQVLRFVNSAYVGIRNPVSNPEQAVVLLGMDATRNLITAANLLSTFQSYSANVMAEKLFEHSYSVGMYASKIVGDLNSFGITVDDAVIAGTLHDVGKLILVTYLPDEWRQALQIVHEHGVPIDQAERAVLGLSHAEIGGYWLGITGLDDHIVQAVAYHHTPLQARWPESPLLLSIHVADAYVYEDSDVETAGQIAKLDMEYLSLLRCEEKLPTWRTLCTQANQARQSALRPKSSSVPRSRPVPTPPKPKPGGIFQRAKKLFGTAS